MLLLFFSLLLSVLHFSQSSWLDTDTPSSAHHISSLVDNSLLSLVFSDEFEVEKRSFKDGSDPRWTSLEKNDYTNDALQYYKDDKVTTKDGSLVISTVIKDTVFEAFDATKKDTKRKVMTKNYQSGMIQGWDKFCFTGGVVEISAKLPGDADIGGLWPAMWLLGNLARATYVASSDNVWPWSYDICSRKNQKEQEISACNVVNHFDLKSRKGRGAPEVDILEAMPGKEVLLNTPINRPYYSASLQTSPGVGRDSRPNTGSKPVHPNKWYHDDISYGENTSLNIYFYGTRLENTVDPEKSYQTDAISANRQLDERYFNHFHKYRLEWLAGDEGYLKWYLDDNFVYGITAETLKLTGSVIPDEPMYLIFNTAMSKTWGFPSPCPANCDCSCFDCRKSECQCGSPAKMCDNFPAEFLIDYVRVYQSPSIEGQKVGCSTPERPTSKFIQGYASRYKQARDAVPLKEVVAGEGECSVNEECTIPSLSAVHAPYGRSTAASAASDTVDVDVNTTGVPSPVVLSGRCIKKRCVCEVDFTGPNCLVRKAGNDIKWEDDDDDLWHQHIRPFYFSKSLKIVCAVFVVAFGGIVGYKLQHERKRRVGRKGYNPIGNNVNSGL